ncbi:MAG: hypothetical protein GY847_40725 [Proteobacteria bacterium]|nr:hypothetical protein [Pseudomonadota bacterium]
MISKKLKLSSLLVISALFLAWAGIFIFKSSFIAVDGERHFCLFDDAMISMRYAWNLSHGNGLIWNKGERVEGFTNMLMVLIMAVSTFLFSKGGAVLAIQIIGATFLLAIGFFTMRIGETILIRNGEQEKTLFSLLFFTGGLLFYPLAYWSLMGMETGLFAALLLFAVWYAMRAESETRFVPLIPILLGLAFWTRPDATVFITLILAYRLFGIIRAEGQLRIFFFDVGIVALFMLGISIFRLWYFGSFLPNTYTLKMEGIPLAFRIENGLGFIERFFDSTWIPLVATALCFAMNLSRHTVLLIMLVLASIGYQIYVGGDPWLYWRMMAPFMPLVFVLVLSATIRLSRLFTSNSPIARFAKVGQMKLRVRLEQALALGALVFVTLTINDTFEEEMIFESLPYMVDFSHATVSIASVLSEVTTEDATVGLLWAGTIPYYTGLEAIDFLGKTNRHIASLPPDLSGSVGWRGMKSVPGHNKYDLNYSVIELKPTYVQEAKWGHDNVLEFLKKEYIGVWYKGMPLMLKKDSKAVRWEIIAKGPKSSPYAVPLERTSQVR